MDTTSPYALLVLGSGPAGVHAAAAYAEHGGPGPVALVSADVDQPYQRPPLSKAVLAGEAPVEGTPVLEEGLPASVEVRLGASVVALDLAARAVTLEGGERLGYQQLVVATGSEALPLPEVAPEARVLRLRSLNDARRLTGVVTASDSAVVVGSGFIGCEAASSLARRGVRTAVVTPEAVPQAGRLGSWAGSRIAEWLQEDGVRLHTGVQVVGVDEPATVRLEDGTNLAADVVLTAVGATQQRSFLDESGLEQDGGRLVVDATMRASDPVVWAAGDVALATHAVAGRRLAVEHWGDAVTMGTLAGTNAAGAAGEGLGQPDRWESPPGFWSEIGGRTLKHAAWGDGHDAEHVVGDDDAFTVWYADDTGELVGVLTHERDEDYDRGREMLARRATLAEALGTAPGADGAVDPR